MGLLHFFHRVTSGPRGAIIGKRQEPSLWVAKGRGLDSMDGVSVIKESLGVVFLGGDFHNAKGIAMNFGILPGGKQAKN